VDAVERYILLGLRLGRHVDGLVDAYFGPPELAASVGAEELAEPAALVADADALLADVPPDTWLHDQVRGLRTYSGVLAGERLSYSEEVEGCYGVRPERTPEAEFEAAHAELDELLPGTGALAGRYERWRESQFVSAEHIPAVAEALVAELRGLTEKLVGLPAGESLQLEPVTDEPWSAFNYYLGDLRSRIAMNVELPMTGWELVELLAHEAYPGHHTEHAWKEHLLVGEQGLLEESILLVPVPQAVVTEGIAETGMDLLDANANARLGSLLGDHGIGVDFESARAVGKAREALRGVGLNVALLIHEDGIGREEAVEYAARWRAVAPEYAASSVRFVTDPTWRAFVVTYSAGRDLCRSFHRGDVGRFRCLLTEQVRVRDLQAGVSSGA
jgi:hypothetical protein